MHRELPFCARVESHHGSLLGTTARRKKPAPKNERKIAKVFFRLSECPGAGALPRLYELNRTDHCAPERNSPKHSHHLLTGRTCR
jgi:hypothetical protein